MKARPSRFERLVLGQIRQRNKREGRPYEGALHRMREVERLMRHRHGAVIEPAVDVDQFIAAAGFCLNVLVDEAEIRPNLEAWVRVFAPWALDGFSDRFEPLRMQLAVRRFNLNAEDAGQLVGLTWQERESLHLKTMWAADVAIDEQRARAAERRRQADIARKRKARSSSQKWKDRDAYLADNPAESTKPWEAEGVSRATWYERRKRNWTGPAHPAQGARSEDWTGPAHPARTGPARTRSNPVGITTYGTADKPVQPSIVPALHDLATADTGGGVKPPAACRAVLLDFVAQRLREHQEPVARQTTGRKPVCADQADLIDMLDEEAS